MKKKQKDFCIIKRPIMNIICPKSYMDDERNCFHLIQSQKKYFLNNFLQEQAKQIVNTNIKFTRKKLVTNKSKSSYEKKLLSRTKYQQYQTRLKLNSNSPYIANKKDFQKVLRLLKPVSGPTQSLLMQIKKHNNQNQDNLQNVLLKTQDNFTSKLAKYKSRVGFTQNCKIFIMNSQDFHIRQALIKNGWQQNMNQESTFFNLKWVYLDASKDYLNLKQSQMYNHFYNNQELTNKNYLRKNIKKNPALLRPNMPNTYNLDRCEDEKEFKDQFQFYQVYQILNSICQRIRLQNEQLFMKFERSKRIHMRYEIIQNKARTRKKIAQIYKKTEKIYQLLFEKTEKSQQMQNLCQNIYNVFAYLVKQIQQIKPIMYSIFIFDDIKWKGKNNYKVFKKLINEQNTSKLLLISTNFFKIQILKMRQYLVDHFGMFGDKNMWILKPTGVSRGTGITISKDLHYILNNKHGRVVQKYIEQPKLLDCGRKFDLRQWVLVKSFIPLQVYAFQSFYCRFSSDSYDINSTDLRKHLTNFTQQKQSYINKKGLSVLSEESIKQIIGENNWKNLKTNINIQILRTLKCCALQIETKVQCFQVYGFDIILDQYLKPWILEVNMSPACQKRSSFLQEYLNKMSMGIVQFIEDRQPTGWEYISNYEKFIYLEKYFIKNISKLIKIQRYVKRTFKNKSLVKVNL